jgi:hypothetical protein
VGDYMDIEQTIAWKRYQKGMDYQSKISLLSKTDKNERFYSGNHWAGIKVNKHPTPILPVTKRIVDWKVSQVMSDLLKMQFSADWVNDNAQDEMSKMYRWVAKMFTEHTATLWENLKMDSMNEKGLIKAALSGSMISHWFWYDKMDAGLGQQGDINGELINASNFCPGDPNTPEINNAYEPVQPYIIIALRRHVEDVREEAKRYGATKEQLELIVGDDETRYESGDMAKSEIEDSGKCVVLIHYWKESEEVPVVDPVTGMPVFDSEGNPVTKTVWHIMCEKCTQNVVIRPKWDTGLHRYPIAFMNWYEREGSAYGEAEATTLIPNQIMINQQSAILALWIKLHGYPKVVYDKSKIDQWSNDITTAIQVNGTDGGGVGGAATYMQPAQIPSVVMQFMQWFIQTTKDMAGANESVLGESQPTNTSAIIVNSKNAVVPLASIKRRFYQYVEDIGLIWLDFFMSKYTDYPVRTMQISGEQKEFVQLDTSILENLKLKLKIEVGPANIWNEAAAIQSLDSWLQMQQISFVEYLKRLPSGVAPDIQGLIEAREGEEAQRQAQEKQLLTGLMNEKLNVILPNLPQDVQNNLRMLARNDPKAYEAQVKQLVSRPYATNVEGVM